MDKQNKLPALALNSIYVAESYCRLSPGFDPLDPADLASFFRTRDVGEVTVSRLVIQREDGSEEVAYRCCFKTEFNFVYARKGESPTDPKTGELSNVVAEITAKIAVAYQAPGPDTPDLEALTAWGNTSVMLHAWPYWREFCHNSQMRMSLPVTMIPLMGIQQHPAE